MKPGLKDRTEGDREEAVFLVKEPTRTQRVLKGRNNHNGQKKGKRDKKEAVCFICNKTGHYARECKNRAKEDKSGEQGSRGRNQLSKNVIHASYSISNQKGEVAIHDWIMDSGFSHHKTHNANCIQGTKPCFTRGTSFPFMSSTRGRRLNTDLYLLIFKTVTEDIHANKTGTEQYASFQTWHERSG
jgi:hypothetical protein